MLYHLGEPCSSTVRDVVFFGNLETAPAPVGVPGRVPGVVRIMTRTVDPVGE